MLNENPTVEDNHPLVRMYKPDDSHKDLALHTYFNTRLQCFKDRVEAGDSTWLFWLSSEERYAIVQGTFDWSGIRNEYKQLLNEVLECVSKIENVEITEVQASVAKVFLEVLAKGLLFDSELKMQEYETLTEASKRLMKRQKTTVEA